MASISSGSLTLSGSAFVQVVESEVALFLGQLDQLAELVLDFRGFQPVQCRGVGNGENDGLGIAGLVAVCVPGGGMRAVGFGGLGRPREGFVAGGIGRGGVGMVFRGSFDRLGGPGGDGIAGGA